MKLEGFSDPREGRGPAWNPKLKLTVPEIHIDSEQAVEPLQDVVAKIPDYSGDNKNVVGPGELTRRGKMSATAPPPRSRPRGGRTRTASSPDGSCAAPCRPPTGGDEDREWADPRFEVLVESRAWRPATCATGQRCSSTRSSNNAGLTFEDSNPYTVSSVLANPEAIVPFVNAGHAGYSGLKGKEPDCASAIDAPGP